MNDTAQVPAASIGNILFKSVLVIAGVGIGGIIGLIVALFMGLIEITC
ncbi:hypothetical protein [Rugamonas rivuli]|nr:hypothetical protein [Rugamonas rivuli]